MTMHLKTPKAREVKLQIVRVFTAWRRGHLQPVAPALPNFADPIAAAEAFIVAERGRREATAQAEAERTLRITARAETEALKPAAQ